MVGYSNVTVRNCYAVGKVKDGTGAGLISSNSGKIFNSYYRSTNKGNTHGFPATTAEMKQKSTFYFWDFENIWEINGSYPSLNVRGTSPSIAFEGDGLSDDPYLIETEEQLYAISVNLTVNTNQTYYQLANDITITTPHWMPIGLYDAFAGTFDGNGHTISNVKVANFEYAGLFGQSSGTIENLTVEGAVSSAGKYNYAGVLVGRNNGRICNCFTSGSATSTSSSESDYCGGLAGRSDGSIVTSGSTATVNGSDYVGGLVGASYSSITNCYAQGDVVSGYYVGGLAGYNGSTIKNCYAVGAIKSSSGRHGGLVGSNGNSVEASYYNADTSGQSDSDKGEPLTTLEMKTATTYIGWDFSEVWAIDASINNGYPYLRDVVPVSAQPSITFAEPVKQSNGTFSFMSDILNGADMRYSYSYDDSWFFEDSFVYQHDLVKMSIRAAMSAFGAEGTKATPKNIEALMTSLKFENIEATYPKPYADGDNTANNTIGYAIGSKNIRNGDGSHCSLLMVAVRGGGYFDEWGDNFNVGTGVEHAGFAGAANKVLTGIQQYLSNHGSELDSNVKIWIMGYSRGAATANIVAKNLDDGRIAGVLPQNVFAFCFECPQNTRSESASDAKYNNIVSIVNPIDFVPKVAMSNWGYKRYGKTYFTPYQGGMSGALYNSLENAMIGKYMALLNPYAGSRQNDVDELVPTTDSQAPKMDILMNTLASFLHSPESFSTNQRYVINLFKNVFGAANANAPTVVKVHKIVNSLCDGNIFAEQNVYQVGILGLPAILPSAFLIYLGYDLGTSHILPALGKSKAIDLGDIAHSHYSELCLSWVDSLEGEFSYADPKYRILFVNCPVDVQVYDNNNVLVGDIANDTVQSVENGVVTFIDANNQKVIMLPADEEYTINMTATDEGTVTYTATSFDIDSGSAEQLVGYYNIPIQSGEQLVGMAENLTDVDEAAYPLSKGGEQLTASISLSGDNVQAYAVAVQTSGNGTAIGGGQYTAGEYALVTASAGCDEDFLGWYVGDTLVSSETEYRFLVESDVTITAKFTSRYYLVYDITVDEGNVNVGITGTDNLDATLMVASYLPDGKFLSSAMTNIHAAGSFEVNLNTEGAETVSAFIVDDNFRPIAQKFSKSIV